LVFALFFRFPHGGLFDLMPDELTVKQFTSMKPLINGGRLKTIGLNFPLFSTLNIQLKMYVSKISKIAND
jgi:hypothetical protein